ncbi:MAG: stage II sporulation protein M, partial [Acidimicrobiales bacterium]
MDIDRFIAANAPTWERLSTLTARSKQGVRDLAPHEVDELVRLYQRASSHLSYARTYYGDPSLLARLTGLVAASGAVVYGTRPRTARALDRFATTTFPAAVWHVRRFVLAAALLVLVPFAAVAIWIASSDEALEASAPDAVRASYVEEDFEAYYSSGPAAAFATNVFTNNVRVAVLAFAAGILLCVVTAGLLAYNGAAVGVAAGLFTAAGQPGRFWGLILPHGLLELSAVIVAGAAGLALGWAVI